MRSHPQDSELFCRYSASNAACLRQLHSQCPDYAGTLPKVLYGWYTVEVNTALSKLCAIMNPLQFMAAKVYCDRQTGSRDFTVEQVLGANLSEYIENTVTAVDGIKSVCRKAQGFLQMAPETENRIIQKCGQDVMTIMNEGMRKTLLVYPCPYRL
ncbi:uncharacterized protein LOC129594719 [Paramacrobiotus metropolitanus]|uniref:uncharacterized protein LOC129594719 n=1 Tax=Paramacrobiotus metropolitanus TaxID=2943436 RepID=UPI0024465083|nr:uncharacterized protein LOC129594719 [Paramacrobiotus metropolitanus]